MKYGNPVNKIDNHSPYESNDSARKSPLSLAFSGPKAKDEIVIGRETYSVLAVSDDHLFVRKRYGDSKSFHITKEEFHALKSKSLVAEVKKSSTPRAITFLNSDLQERSNRIRAYCEALDREELPCAKGVRERVINKVSNEIGDKSPISPSTLSRWHSIWRNDRSLSDYFARYTRSKRGLRMNREIEEIITNCIDRFYAKKSMPSKTSAYKNLLAILESKGLSSFAPSESTFRRRIELHDHAKIIQGRKGRDAARAAKRTDVKPIEARYPCDIVHADGFHVQARIECENGYITDNAIIIVILDVFSRAVMGWAVSFGQKDLPAAETSALVMQALIHAVLPKDNPDFPIFGAFREIVYDNGSGFISDETTMLLQTLAASCSPHSTKAPWKKGVIERFGRTLRQSFLCDVSSYMGKRSSGSTLSKKDFPVIKKEDFMKKLAEFFIYDYNCFPHSGIKGLSPIIKWQQGLEDACFEPACPMAPENLRLFRGIRAKRLPSDRATITLNNQKFNSYQLSNVISSTKAHFTNSRSKPAIEILYNPFDASAITVINPETGEMIEVPNRENVAPMTSFNELNYAIKENHKSSIVGSKRIRDKGLINREANRSVLCSEIFTDDEGDTDGRPSYYEEQTFARGNDGFIDEE